MDGRDLHNWGSTIGSWSWLDAVTVRTSAATGAVVALGDSLLRAR